MLLFMAGKTSPFTNTGRYIQQLEKGNGYIAEDKTLEQLIIDNYNISDSYFMFDCIMFTISINSSDVYFIFGSDKSTSPAWLVGIR